MNTITKLKKFSGKNFYFDRKSRYEFLVKEFNNFLEGDLLDVGCDKKYLKNVLSENINYVGIDKNSDADVYLDLDKESIFKLNKKFDTVICTDVLEHTENIHRVFDEIIDISRKYIILSLPNAWFEFKKIPVLKNSGKFYGLPIDVPIDRHRWFFNFAEAMNFIKMKSSDKVKEIHFYPYFHKTNKLIKFVAKNVMIQEKYLNLFSPTLWAVIIK